MRRLDERTLVAGQIMPGDVAMLAAEGVTMIVNNRPDGETPGQPAGATIEAAAAAAGIGYRHIPISGGFSDAQIEALGDAMALPEGDILLFCTSGTRSAWLWALVQARGGEPVEAIVAKAEAAGYDLTPLKTYLG